MINLLEYLENSKDRFPKKNAFIDRDKSITFEELYNIAVKVGGYICEANKQHNINKPICVIGERGIDVLVCMFGCLYSGNFYVLIDGALPKERIDLMVRSIMPLGIIVTNGSNYAYDDVDFCFNYSEDSVVCVKNDFLDVIKSIRSQCHSFDPAYGVFTSGSTGVPKLVVKSHQALIEFIEVYTDMFGFSDSDILGNQFPFYFDASTKDIFSCLKCGITTHIIPKEYFSFPKELVKYLIEKAITKIVWVPSALTLVANANLFEELGVPSNLDTVLFVGEQMPIKQLNYWKSHLQNARFINLYGSTEVAGNFLYYEYKTMLDPALRLPTGQPFPNTKVILLNNDQKEITEVEVEGEICVTGNTLSSGYYHNEELTNSVFVQNPLVSYREILYKTGDLAHYDKNGNIVWSTRKDFQIKHMGYRIELSEIDTIVGALAGIDECCSVYDDIQKKIILFYTAKEDMKKALGLWIRGHMPKYMFPSRYERIDNMPHNQNGKIDRKALSIKVKNNE